MAEYQFKINDLIQEYVLKMITNPLYFNSTGNKWGWQQRREVLLGLAGPIDNTEILDSIYSIDNSSEILALSNALNAKKTVAEYKLEIASRKKHLKDELVQIPTRIDELTRSKPLSVDFGAVESAIADNDIEIKNIDAAISDRNLHYQNEYKKIQQKQAEIHDLKTRRNAIVFDVRTEISKSTSNQQLKKNELAAAIFNIEADIKSKTTLLNSRNATKEELKVKTEKLRALWKATNERELVLDQHLFECPTCRRAFEEGDINSKKAELNTNFIETKNRELNDINIRGKALVAEVADCDSLISTVSNALEGLKVSLADAKANFTSFDRGDTVAALSLDEALGYNDEYVNLGAKIARMESEASEVKPADTMDLTIKKSQINKETDQLKKQLAGRDQIVKIDKRIAELEKEERDLSQKLAALEKNEFLIESFTRAKMDILEQRINGMFEHVTFKLFDRQINGGESETCETMYKGVPFSALNNAGKIWAGIDIINTLSRFYQMQAPIFLDNRESVTNIPETEAQIINLVVSPEDKVLRVA